MDQMTRELRERIEARRADVAFMERLRRHLKENAVALERLAE
jgi:hypothetical protein